ncbi:MAG TPA: endonuclease/exonuclease/phosphatase family protein [Anaerolineales bacterium]
MRRWQPWRSLEAAVVWLYLFQALRVIFSVLFGIIYDRLIIGPMDAWMVGSVLLLAAAFALPALAPRQGRAGWLTVAAGVVIVARVGLSINDPDVRYWSALSIIAGAGLYQAALLERAGKASMLGGIMALAADQTLRAAGHTYDISLRQSWLPVQIALTAAGLLLVYWTFRNRAKGRREPVATGALWGLALGGMVFIETSLLSLPNAVARWSGAAYSLVTPLLLAITLIFLNANVRWGMLGWLRGSARLRIAAGFSLPALLLAGYFAQGWAAMLALLAAQMVILMAWVYLLAGVERGRSSAGRQLAAGLLFLLALNFLNAFTFTYAYTLPFLRGLGWTVYLAAGLATGLAMTGRKRMEAIVMGRSAAANYGALGALVLLGITSVAAWPMDAAPLAQDGRLRVGTYNMHYGYDEAWQLTLEAIADTIEADGLDIVALQEVDTGRLTSYGVDNAYYLARRLGMNALYVPTVEHLTGIAMLYRGKATETGSQLLSSLQEQTGIAHVQLAVDGGPLHAYGIWIGLSNEDTLRQIREGLEFIGDSSPAVLGGDFNSTPGSEVAAAIRAAGFSDPFELLEVQPIPATAPAGSPDKRIDYVWVRGARPVEAWVSPSLASDHRLVGVEVGR